MKNETKREDIIDILRKNGISEEEFLATYNRYMWNINSCEETVRKSCTIKVKIENNYAVCPECKKEQIELNDYCGGCGQKLSYKDIDRTGLTIVKKDEMEFHSDKGFFKVTKEDDGVRKGICIDFVSDKIIGLNTAYKNTTALTMVEEEEGVFRTHVWCDDTDEQPTDTLIHSIENNRPRLTELLKDSKNAVTRIVNAFDTYGKKFSDSALELDAVIPSAISYDSDFETLIYEFMNVSDEVVYSDRALEITTINNYYSKSDKVGFLVLTDNIDDTIQVKVPFIERVNRHGDDLPDEMFIFFNDMSVVETYEASITANIYMDEDYILDSIDYSKDAANEILKAYSNKFIDDTPLNMQVHKHLNDNEYDFLASIYMNISELEVLKYNLILDGSNCGDKFIEYLLENKLKSSDGIDINIINVYIINY